MLVCAEQSFAAGTISDVFELNPVEAREIANGLLAAAALVMQSQVAATSLVEQRSGGE